MIHEQTFCIIIWQSPIVITTPPPTTTLATIHLLFCEIYKHITYYDPRTDFLYYNLTIPRRDYTWGCVEQHLDQYVPSPVF